MKKIFLLFLLLFSPQILSQAYKYAILSDIKTGNENNTEKLSKVIEDIKSRQEIEFAIIIGNITENGTSKDLDSAKEILDHLAVPYFVIPGNIDTKLSENSLIHFRDLFNDKFFFKKNHDIHIGLNSCITWDGKTGHFYPEDLKWLNQVLKDSVKSISNSSSIIMYLYHPLNSEIDNWFEASNILRNYNIKTIFTGEGEKNKLLNFNDIPGAVIQPVSGESKYPGYFIIESNGDSLIITQVELGRKKSEKVLNIISKEKKYEIAEIDSLQFIDYANNILWEKDLNTSLPAPFEASADKIFAAAKNGNVICFDLNGNKIWEYDTGETIVSKPAVEGDILSIATLEGDLFSINANNGNVIQVIGLGKPLTSQLTIINTVNQDSKTKGVIAGTADGNLYCYDIYTLENIWENTSAKGMIKALPLFIKDRVIYSSGDGFLYCIDAKSGILNWKWKNQGIPFGDKNSDYSIAGCEPVSDGKYVYISSTDKYVYAIDLLLGTTIWRSKDYSSWESLGISSDNEMLFVKGLNYFYLVSSKTGKQIKEIKIDYGEDYFPNRPIEWNKKIIFGSENGNVYLIDQRYNSKKLFFAGTASINNIEHVKDDIFAASNIDGKIILFTIK